MKIVRVLLIAYIIAYAAAFGSTYINDNIIVSDGAADRYLEAAVVALPIFVFLLIMYVMYRGLLATIKYMKKKKPSGSTKGSDNIT